MKPKQAVPIILLLLTVIFGHAQKNYQAESVQDSPPGIDGVFDDKAWKKAKWINDFKQHQPYEGKQASQNTVFKIVYDDNFIYVAIRAFDTDPDKIERQLSRRDNVNGDFVRIIFDSYYDQRTAFQFSVSAAGVKQDAVISNDGSNFDDNWDPIWYAQTQIDEKGWTAEMKIPFTQLRFAKTEKQLWGLEVIRYIYRLEETNQWKLISQDAAGYVSEFGTLSGMDNINPKKEASVTPYVVTSIDQFNKDVDNPFEQDGYKFKYNGGVNGKFGITNNITLDMAINPDFGQVEADPSEVNLSAYESFYEEKRPFFIEGSNIMNFRLMPMGDFMSDNIFYSRRIGRNPHYYPDLEDNEYMERPQNSSILGAFKMTGKTNSGWSVGVLEAVTQNEFAKIDNGTKDSTIEIEPLTNYFLGRIERDFNDGNTVVGGIFTATHRKIDVEHLDYLHTQAYTGGVNFKHQWKDKTYIVQYNGVFSHVKGSKEAISETQLSSAHYFDRSDSKHLHYDSTRQSLTGSGSSLMIGKMGKGHFMYALFLNMKSPELELNDIGYQREADHLSELFWAQFRTLEPKGIFRRFHININQWEIHDFAGTRLNTGGNFNLGGSFTNYWSVYYGMNGNIYNMSNGALWGGPYLLEEPSLSHWISINTDQRKKFRVSFGGSQSWAKHELWHHDNLWASFSYRPHQMLDISFSPSIMQSMNKLQYVTTDSYNGQDRYIMASIDQKIMVVSLRVNLCITPTLSIQYWGQPFIGTGKYSDFKYITDPKANKLDDRFNLYTSNQLTYNSDDEIYEIDENNDLTVDYTFDKPDFDALHLISNLVIRWEYLPGSEIYLVWTQNRHDHLNNGNFNFNRNSEALANVDPYNVFLIKATYRFGFND